MADIVTASDLAAARRRAEVQAAQIADTVTAGPGIAGFSGINPNTRRIARAAAERAVLIALEVDCPECKRTTSHGYGCSLDERNAK